MKTLKRSALLLTMVILSSCSDNPLLGTWKAKSGQNSAYIACPEITFTESMSRCGGIVEEVDYEVQGNLVIVSSDLGDIFGMKVAYELADDNTMIMDIPFAGEVVYKRKSY
jgi:hypothetical protein